MPWPRLEKLLKRPFPSDQWGEGVSCPYAPPQTTTRHTDVTKWQHKPNIIPVFTVEVISMDHNCNPLIKNLIFKMPKGNHHKNSNIIIYCSTVLKKSPKIYGIKLKTHKTQCNMMYPQPTQPVQALAKMVAELASMQQSRWWWTSTSLRCYIQSSILCCWEEYIAF